MTERETRDENMQTNEVEIQPIPTGQDKWTVVFQYDTPDGPNDPPNNIQERVLMAAQALHEMGFGLDVRWGQASSTIMDMVDEG